MDRPQQWFFRQVHGSGPADRAPVRSASGTCWGGRACDGVEDCGGTRYRPALSGTKQGRTPLLSSAGVLRSVDSMGLSLNQAYQLARARMASAGSPILRLPVRWAQRPLGGARTTLARAWRQDRIFGKPRGGREQTFKWEMSICARTQL